jgi:hypothetical protein
MDECDKKSKDNADGCQEMSTQKNNFTVTTQPGRKN